MPDAPIASQPPRRRLARIIVSTLAAGTVTAAITANRWQRTWGTTEAERERTLPGDDLVRSPRLEATRAIGLDAPPQRVWPWLVQMGQDKAGFYSIEALENAIGLDIANAEDVHPEWQGLTVGDPVALGPGIALTAAIVEVDRALVLQGDDPAVDSSFGLPDEFTWAFVLEPEGPAGTRLVIRERYAFPRYAAAWFHLVTWVSWLMTRAMLRGIRHRAEHHRAST